MRRIGIPIDKSMWMEVRSHICLDHSGKVVCEVPVQEVTTAWDRVYRALRQALPIEHYHGGMTLARCEQNEHRVLAVFANGVSAQADLLISADGMRSTVRRQFMPEIAPRYAGYVAWRGVVAESQIPPDWRGRTLSKMVFCLPEESWHSPSRWRLRTIWGRFGGACSCGSVLPSTVPPCGGGAQTRPVTATAIRSHPLLIGGS